MVLKAKFVNASDGATGLKASYLMNTNILNAKMKGKGILQLKLVLLLTQISITV